jgi:hypothetical protein
MTDPPAYPGAGDDTGAEADSGPAPGTPRWVKVSGVVAVVVVLLIVVLLLVGEGDHGPGRHTGTGDRSSPAADHTPPAGGHARE